MAGDVVSVSRLRGILAGILGSVFLLTVYVASRAPSLRPIRVVVSGSAGLICGCLCAGSLGRGAFVVLACGLVGALLGVSSDFWLSKFQEALTVH
jgi:uncharacterized membrane protein YeaQ/YmgE (transglycosylase-associated protein family)